MTFQDLTKIPLTGTTLSLAEVYRLAHYKTVCKLGYADIDRELSEKEIKSARKALDEAGVRHDIEIRTGHVAQEIVACAKSGKFDFIVMGGKGRGALADLLLGWREAGITGFRLRPGAIPHDLKAITRALVPELQRRGGFRTSYGSPTLRGLLGLPRPANRYAAARA